MNVSTKGVKKQNKTKLTKEGKAKDSERQSKKNSNLSKKCLYSYIILNKTVRLVFTIALLCSFEEAYLAGVF